MTFYIAKNGNDEWQGTCPDPTPDALDGPFASLGRAVSEVRKLKGHDGLKEPVTVMLREGIYELESAWKLGPDDAGSPAPTDDWNKHTGPECSVTWCAYDGESVVLSGGTKIAGWRPGSINGHEAWVATAHLHGGKKGFFTQLFVNGRRAKRSRLPETGVYQVEKPLGTVIFEGPINEALFTGQDEFLFEKGALKNWGNPQDIEFVGLHYWIESRINFKDINEDTRTAALARKTRMRLTDDFSADGAPYYVENVKEAVQKPGQWYLDRPTDQVYYIPLKGEKIDTAEIFAPRLERIVRFQGLRTTK